MQQRRIKAVAIGSLALVASMLAVTQPTSAAPAPASAPAPATDRAQRSTVPSGFVDTVAFGAVTEPVGVAFAPDGTAFVALKTGVIKSFDYDAATDTFESSAAATDFADLTVATNNYGDRGMTGITVDPQFPARPYVYVNYTFNKDPRSAQVPRWGVPGQAYDECGPNDQDEASLSPVRTGCPAMIRVSRLTAQPTALGWVMAPGTEKVLVESGCAQFSSHASGDVAFGPDGKLYASAGDGASFLGQDYGQANNPCGDPANEGGSLRAQDQRTGGDPLGIDGTIFRMNPDTGFDPATDSADGWLVALGQRNPWRLTFRQGKEQLWSVDVGSSNFEEINQLVDAPTTGLVNRGWPCYEGTTGVSTRNAAWDALDKPICENLYAQGSGAVTAPVFAYPTTNSNRTATVPLTPGENCPSVSSSMSGVAFSQLGTDWPAAYQDALYFTDFLRGCIWRLEKDANGQPDPSQVRLFAQTVGAPVDLTPGPGGDLYYVDYGLGDAGVIQGGGSVHRIGPPAPAPVSTLTVKSKPKKLKVKIKVDGKKHRTTWSESFAAGTSVRLVAPKRVVKKGVRYVFEKWKDSKKAKRKRTVVVGATPLTLKLVYRRVGRG